ncbi:MAG: helix-turn-helix transcriptional regulator [Acidobacteriota bacterium]
MKIRNQWQYRHAKAQAEKFAAVLAQFDDRPEAHPGVHPRLILAQKESVASELEVLRQEIGKYENLRRKKSGLKSLKFISNLPETLVKARIAAGLTQSALAKKLGLKPQQIQRYEATDYAQASLARIQQIASVIESVSE